MNVTLEIELCNKCIVNLRDIIHAYERDRECWLDVERYGLEGYFWDYSAETIYRTTGGLYV